MGPYFKRPCHGKLNAKIFTQLDLVVYFFRANRRYNSIEAVHVDIMYPFWLRAFQKSLLCTSGLPLLELPPQSSTVAMSLSKEPALKTARTTPPMSSKKEDKKKAIIFGSDFTGLSSQSTTLNALKNHYGMKSAIQHKFACDNNPQCKKVIHHNEATSPEVFFDDVTTRDANSMPYVDFYQYTAPCQGVSKAGKQNGNDPRNLLAAYGLRYVKSLKPICFISEQVPMVGKYAELEKFILDEHRRNGYYVTTKVVNSQDYLFPQNRMRWYCVGIREDMLRTRSGGISIFPECVPALSLSSIIQPILGQKWLAHPPSGDRRANVLTAYANCGCNPFTVPVVVDAGSSPQFSGFQVNATPTLTASRSSQASGYWCSTKGGPLNLQEMKTLQGYSNLLGTNVPLEEAGISRTAAGHMVGNAQSANFLLLLYPRVLFHAQLITLQEFRTIQQNLNSRFSSLGRTSSRTLLSQSDLSWSSSRLLQ